MTNLIDARILIALIPIPLLSASNAFAHTPAYMTGYNVHDISVCDEFQLNTPPSNDCVQAVNDAAYHSATMTPFKIGYVQGQKDASIGITTGVCSQFNNTGNFSPGWACDQGYNAGMANATISPTAVAAMKQTPAYQAGWIGGLRNEGASLACDPYIDRDEKICLKGHDDAVLSLGFSKSAIYKQGFEYGKRAAEGKETLDRYGDCSYDPADIKKTQTCKSGWNSGWDSVKHPRPND